jgi:hypothetical protein
MLVISSAELRNNMKKYLDLAKTQEVVIQRGRTETFVLSEERHLDPDDDLARAITAEQLLERVIPRIEKMFEK